MFSTTSILEYPPVNILHDEQKSLEIFYANYSKEEILTLLKYCEMICFHSLILLISSKNEVDKNDKKLYKNEFEEIIRADFVEDETQVEKDDQMYR